jgi:hypothetical protein
LRSTYSIDDPIEVLQTLLLEYSRVHVILEVSVVDGESNAVQAERCETFRILFGEKVVQELEARDEFMASYQGSGVLTRSKKNSYFSGPKTFLSDFRTWTEIDK